MSMSFSGAAPIPALSPGVEVRKTDTPERVGDAAQQFEALLLAQILRSERESSGRWLGNESGAAGDAATEFAEQQLAVALARGGGLGLANLIAAGLRPDR
jgi:Rod binding domain-containing protein